ncbi:MAG: undecaprenyl-phosphate glucose phosphotransferase [Nitrospirae bacterium]|nr:undecaprenyl-phosphate glucose phosphotransferase [Nitrospirota bacterium]
MLKKYSEFFKSLLFILDLVLISAAWLSAYALRFYTDLVPVTKGVPFIEPYLILLPAILVVWGIVFKAFDLYRPRRIASHLSEIWDITKACSLATLLIVALSFFLRQFEYSRMVFIFFWGFSILLITMSRWGFRELVRFFRRKGYNLRYALIVGAGPLGQELAARLHRHRELGIKVIGYLTRKEAKVGRELRGIEVLGTYDELPKILEARPVDQVFLALPHDAYANAEKIFRFLQGQTTDVRIVPDLLQFMTVRGQAELFDGLPIVTLQATPLYGWNRILKRATDILFSLTVLILTSPLLSVIAVLIKLTSPGPVLYRQKRMGYDGRLFEMLKFRSMRADAEKESGAVWAQADDPRRTSLGNRLRRTSLDELPQFFNVLKGEMSIVGPRPERPEFVEKFRAMIPRYMLRHKIKAGITGWAQVNGWRGNTSLEERIKCDLEYIEKWSLGFDLKIMWLTLWKGLINRNAY